VWVIGLALVGLAGGCVAAAAGAGAGYYFTSRGVGSTVAAPVNDVAQRTEAVFAEEGIVLTETTSQPTADKRHYKGQKGDIEVNVELDRQSDTTTKAEVSARKNLVQWDKDYARSVMDRIVQVNAAAPPTGPQYR
jgi:hypothetical protein